MDSLRTMRHHCFRLGLRVFRPEVLAALARMERWESLAPEMVRRLQLEKLNALLSFHRQRPFYLELCEAVGAPSPPLRDVSQLTRYPTVTKECLRSHRAAVSATPEAYRELSTSGSSGINLSFHQSREMAMERTACVHRLSRWVGYDNWSDRTVVIWGRSPQSSMIKGVRDRLKRWALNTTLLPSFGMNDTMALKYVRRIHHVRPTVIDGYPSYLSRLARAALASDVPRHTSAIVTHSGEQALPSDLEAIRAFFGNEVYARYGSREFGPIAHEVPGESGYRVAPTRFIVENDPDAGLLITDLDNLATPFIRYTIGDVGSVVDEEHEDAPTPQRILELSGRIYDRLETPDGRLIPGQFWTLLTRTVPGIEEFQVVQTAPDSVELRVQVDPSLFHDRHRDEVLRGAHVLLAGSMEVSVVRVDQVERSDMGKRRFIVRGFGNS